MAAAEEDAVVEGALAAEEDEVADEAAEDAAAEEEDTEAEEVDDLIRFIQLYIAPKYFDNRLLNNNTKIVCRSLVDL